jgi:hypothetical protein
VEGEIVAILPGVIEDTPLTLPIQGELAASSENLGSSLLGLSGRRKLPWSIHS